MRSFIRRLFIGKSVERKLFLAISPIVFALIVLDYLFSYLGWYDADNGVFLVLIKLLFAIPAIIFVIYFLSQLFDHKLSETEKALLKSEERFRSIFENNTSAISIIQPDSTILMVNEAFCQMSGYTKEDIQGKSWTDQIFDEDLERMKEYNLRRLNNDPNVPEKYEFKFYKKNREVRYGLMSVFHDKSLNQFIISFTDISKRKEMEEDLRNSKENYQYLIESQGEGLGIVDKDEIFIFCNPAAEHIMGVAPGGLLGKKLNDFVSSETLELIQTQTELRKQGNRSTYEMEIIRPNGEKRAILVTVTPKIDKRGNFEGSLGIFMDITDRSRVEAALKSSENELKEINKTKDKLFSIIAHDLRGPIGTSGDLLELLLEGFDTFSKEEQLHMLKILMDSSKSTYNLLDTLLNWAVVQTGNLVFKPEFFNLTKAIQTNVNNLAPSAYSKNLSLNFDTAEEIFVFADQNMINTVIRNLIGNAIKYTFRGGAIHVRLRSVSDSIEIMIEDNGVGMDEQVKSNLFILNKQNSKYGTENEKGTGLGLILCKDFVEKHGGTISVQSEVQKGSKFCITIPKRQGNTEILSHKLKAEEVRFDGELILIVEDDDINYQVIKSILSGVNLSCERATNGREGVDMFLKNSYRMILMDIQLPELNGWEATLKIRESDSEIPIIAITAYASDPTKKRSLQVGCNDSITKPIYKEKLIQLIDKYLKKSYIGNFIV